MPEQRNGAPRRRCPACAAKRRLDLMRSLNERRSSALLSLTPRRCVICNGEIPRLKGKRPNDRYCSPECQHEGGLRRQRITLARTG